MHPQNLTATGALFRLCGCLIRLEEPGHIHGLVSFSKSHQPASKLRVSVSLVHDLECENIGEVSDDERNRSPGNKAVDTLTPNRRPKLSSAV